MEKIKTARKEYACDCCNNPIKRGSKYSYQRLRIPKYAECKSDPTEDGEQIGVEYITIRLHLPEEMCLMTEVCKQGKHEMISYTDTDFNSPHCGETFTYCEQCNYSLEEIEKCQSQQFVNIAVL